MKMENKHIHHYAPTFFVFINRSLLKAEIVRTFINLKVKKHYKSMENFNKKNMNEQKSQRDSREQVFYELFLISFNPPVTLFYEL